MLDFAPIFMFLILLIFIMFGFPVCFTLAGTSLLFAAIGVFSGTFYLSDLGFIPTRVFGVMQNYTLIAVPLFVFMGLVLSKSGIAESLFKAIESIFKKIPASMAVSVVIVGMLLGASTGIAGATVVTMGLLSLPSMLEGGYSKRIASGTVVASGTLGQIIPPSIILILLGDLMNVDIGDLFLAALVPGGVLVTLYILYILIATKSGRDKLIPVVSKKTRESINIKEASKAIFPPLFLVVVVLGSILFGVASPTEAASCGAVVSILMAVFVYGLKWKALLAVSEDTVRISSMVFFLLVGAQFFGVTFRGLGGDHLIQSLVAIGGISPTFIVVGFLVLIFILGFFLDFLEISFILIPIMYPIFNSLGIDMVWLAILIAINLQTSFLTPPFGFALFYLKGVAPSDVRTVDIYSGVVPFIIIQLLVLSLVYFYPAILLK